MTTNALDPRTASTLAEIGSLDQGTLVSLTIHKKGTQRGPKGAKVVYGDDFVHTLIWSGFEYKALVERSLKKLTALEDEGTLITSLTQEVIDSGCVDVTVQDTCAAIQELKESFKRVVEEPDGPKDTTQDDPNVWEPLTVEGVKVRGSKVYVGNGDDSNPRAPKKGTVYIDGVKLGEKVLTPAANGPWETRSKPKTLVKNLLRRKLPVGRYVRYALEPDRLLGTKVGAAASESALDAGLPINPEAIRQLFKIAP